MTAQRNITAMFDDIAPRYDFLNHLLSFHIDRIWRRKVSKAVTKSLQHLPEPRILDVATGTADLAIRMAKDLPEASITGIDLSEKMLQIGREKVRRKKMEQRVVLSLADAQRLPFADGDFDAVTVAFGVRNFEELQQSINEMARVLKEGGIMAVLEFSQPSNRLIWCLYQGYSRHLLPRVGRRVSGNQKAYSYLPESIDRFSASYDFIETLRRAGMRHLQARALSGGIATLYLARK